MDELRFRSQQSSRTDATMNGLVSPPRTNSSRFPQPMSPHAHDQRTNLTRRFTADSSLVPTLSTMTSGPDYSAMHKVQLIEKKKQDYERIREQRRRFEMEMARLDQAQRREAQELAQMEEEMTRLGVQGHQSEPTTPPEYRDNNSGFPSIFSRPNRYSTSSLTSPPGLFNRPARSGSQLTSPGAGRMSAHYGFEDALPSRSVPTTRRNSDDGEKEEAVRQDPSSHRSSNALNRYSMPVTRSRNGLYEVNLDQANTTRFLFGDDDSGSMSAANGFDSSFPTLVRRDDQVLSASSAALDLALSASPHIEATPPHHWSNINRHRPQQSLSSINGLSSQSGDLKAIGSRPASLRHSLDLKFFDKSPESSGNGVMASHNNHNSATPPKLQSSFSANEIPTMKNNGSAAVGNGNANNHAQQHFHNHNVSMGRIPAGIMPARHSRELSGDSGLNGSREQGNAFQSLQSALQGSAAPFGPSTTAAVTSGPASTVTSPTNGSMMGGMNNFYPGAGYQQPNGNGVAGSYGMPGLNAGMQQMAMNGVNGGNMYPQQQPFPAYNPMPFNQPAQPRDSQARVMQHRRQLDSEAMSRYQNMPLDSFRGQIYELCKDQHGCRYLQRKLEERNAEQVHTIWQETNQHVVELMTDPFGNYLCQKLLEYCNDDERTVLIQNSSQDMVRIALNQHGTRALQKMIEFVNTPQQVHLIIEALRFRVVELIQDLNGNHVIQKCLNKLTSMDAQFIFEAVGNNCVEVGTHRHGCCVLQRCIDHTAGEQKLWLIQRITEHARVLVQDPFGNYVVQYIIDLNEPSFTEPVVAMFQGCISQLSRHKFSSNVIEKCLRCAQAPSKDLIVEELLVASEMERLLRDSFANYVIQTALDHATPGQKHRLVEAIRPLLPQIRTTPYGRRIQAKVSAYDNRGNAAASGQQTPADNTQGQIPLRQQTHARGLSGSAAQSMVPSNGGMSNGSAPQPMPPYGNGPVLSSPNGMPANGAQPGFAPGRPGAANPSENGEQRWM